MNGSHVEWVVVARQRARQAEAAATEASTDVSKEVLIAVSELWYRLALSSARAMKAADRRRRLEPSR